MFRGMLPFLTYEDGDDDEQNNIIREGKKGNEFLLFPFPLLMK